MCLDMFYMFSFFGPKTSALALRHGNASNYMSNEDRLTRRLVTVQYTFVYTKTIAEHGVCAGLRFLRDSEVVPRRTVTVVVDVSLVRVRAFNVRILGVVTPRTEQYHVYDGQEDFRHHKVGTLIRFSRCSGVFSCILRSIRLCFPPMLYGWLHHFLFCGLPWLFAMFLR